MFLGFFQTRKREVPTLPGNIVIMEISINKYKNLYESVIFLKAEKITTKILGFSELEKKIHKDRYVFPQNCSF